MRSLHIVETLALYQMFEAWSPAKLDHAIACAERAFDGLAHTKSGSYTAQQLRVARPPCFPLAPFTTQEDYNKLHFKKMQKEFSLGNEAKRVIRRGGNRR